MTLMVKGNSVADIQRSTGYSRKEIETHLQSFREFTRNDKVMVERSREIAIVTDHHYSVIIKGLYQSIEEADLNNDYKSKATFYKMLADVEKQRVDFLQKAGLMSENTLGDRLVEQEEQHRQIIELLAKLCPNCKAKLAKELSDLTEKVEPVFVVDA